MVVEVTDFAGHTYEVFQAQLIFTAIAGPCIRGHYKPVDELVMYDQGDFALEKAHSWEIVSSLPIGRNGGSSSLGVAVPSAGGGV